MLFTRWVITLPFAILCATLFSLSASALEAAFSLPGAQAETDSSEAIPPSFVLSLL